MSLPNFFGVQPTIRADGAIEYEDAVYEPWPSLRIIANTKSELIVDDIVGARPGDLLWTFMERIPESVREAVGSLPVYRWPLLQLCAANPERGLDLIHRCPALAILVAESKMLWHRANSRYFASVLARRWRDIAGEVGLPATKSSVQVLSRLERASCQLSVIHALRERMRSPWLRVVRHLPRISRDTVALLGLPPEIVSPRLLAESINTPPDEERVAWCAQTVRFLRREFYGEGSWPYGNCSFQELTRIERRLLRLHRDDPDTLAEFPPPPFPGIPGVIEPIQNADALAQEGEQQLNCSYEFLGDILHRESFLYRLHAPERATLALRFDRGELRWVIDDLKARDNRAAAGMTLAFVQHWLAQVKGKEAADERR